jgi:mannan endo-1,4-beta-mannosidase
MLALWQESKNINGNSVTCNFWLFDGIAGSKSSQIFWKLGNDYMGDPSVEEQGLNTVFDSDISTGKLIYSFTKKYK